jgi:hypothetical protein
MTVYAIVQLKMIDRAAYDRYQARFLDVFKKFSGRLLSAADEKPTVVEGAWDRTVTTAAQTQCRGRTALAPHTGRADSHKVGRSNKRGHRDGGQNAGHAGRDAAR